MFLNPDFLSVNLFFWKFAKEGAKNWTKIEIGGDHNNRFPPKKMGLHHYKVQTL